MLNEDADWVDDHCIGNYLHLKRFLRRCIWENASLGMYGYRQLLGIADGPPLGCPTRIEGSLGP